MHQIKPAVALEAGLAIKRNQLGVAVQRKFVAAELLCQLHHDVQEKRAESASVVGLIDDHFFHAAAKCTLANELLLQEQRRRGDDLMQTKIENRRKLTFYMKEGEGETLLPIFLFQTWEKTMSTKSLKIMSLLI